MGFKNDESFLRFIRMGATGAKRVLDVLRSAGFEPVELERYSTSTKIWSTKVKRLRLPDLLCVRTGLRVEVRAKSKLAIKVSDAPNSADRRWNSGLRAEDLIAFVACSDAAGTISAAAEVNFFRVDILAASEATSVLGKPKAASEGSERDRNWPAYVPTCDGKVVEVVTDLFSGKPSALRLLMSAEGKQRSQNYPLKGKHSYVHAGESFLSGATIVAGSPSSKAPLEGYSRQRFDVIACLESTNIVDRYAAAKAIPYRSDIATLARKRLEVAFNDEEDQRVKLELGASACALGLPFGETALRDVVMNEEVESWWHMETAFVLTELRTDFAFKLLCEIAKNSEMPSELRQAAVWGLGFAGHERYAELLKYLADDDEGVAMHAIAAFGPRAPNPLVKELVARLDERNSRLAAASSEALRLVGSDEVVLALAQACNDAARRIWAIATLGRIDPIRVRRLIGDGDVLRSVAPLMRVFSENWLSVGNRQTSLAFLLAQR